MAITRCVPLPMVYLYQISVPWSKARVSNLSITSSQDSAPGLRWNIHSLVSFMFTRKGAIAYSEGA